MSWAIGYDDNWQRDIGYGVPAICDHPHCNRIIDRGLSYVCGNGMPHGGEDGCGLYFCHTHGGGRLCAHCTSQDGETFLPKADIPEWASHKLTHPSWSEWRAENPERVRRICAVQALAQAPGALVREIRQYLGANVHLCGVEDSMLDDAALELARIVLGESDYLNRDQSDARRWRSIRHAAANDDEDFLRRVKEALADDRTLTEDEIDAAVDAAMEVGHA